MAVQIQLRRDTTANWEAENPTLAQGEIGIDLTLGDFKIGDGVNTWTALDFMSGASSWDDISDKPTVFAPDTHGNEAHSSTFITAGDIPASLPPDSHGNEAHTSTFITSGDLPATYAPSTHGNDAHSSTFITSGDLPATYAPSTHGNDAHSSTFITAGDIPASLPPDSHGNEAHTSTFITSGDLPATYTPSEHGNDAHSSDFITLGDLPSTMDPTSHGNEAHTSTFITAGDIPASLPPDSHGNEAHTSTFITSGDLPATMPPDSHGNEAHTSTFITSGDLPATYAPSEHGNDAHSSDFITLGDLPATMPPSEHGNDAHSSDFITLGDLPATMDPTAHAGDHIDGGSDAIDGDKLEISWAGMANYTRATVESYSDQTDQLTSHLKGIDTALASIGDPYDDTQLWNNLMLVGWQAASGPLQGDDYFQDTFDDTTGIDPASIYTDHTGSGYVSLIPSASGQTVDSDIVDASDYAQLDLKGTIAKWHRVSANTGHFATSGGTTVSVGAGNTNANVVAGMTATINSVAYTISSIDAGGTTVVLSGDPSNDTTVASIVGLVISGVNITVSSGFTSASTYSHSSGWADNDGAGYSFRVVIPASEISTSGTAIRLTIKSNSAHDSWMDNVSIGERSSGSATTATPTSFLFSGGAAAHVTAGSTLTSDWLTFSLDQTKDYVITFDVSDTNGYYAYDYSSASGFTSYYAAGTNSYNQSAPGGFSEQANVLYYAYSMDVQSGAYASGSYPAITTASHTRLDSTTWSAIEDVTATQVNATSYIYHAVKFNGDTGSWFAWVSSAQRAVVRNNGGTWEYNNAAGSWTSATINSELGALFQALAISQNQMTNATMAGMSTANWVTLGFDPAQTTFDLCCALKVNGTDNPTLSKWTVTYSTLAQDMDLITDTVELTVNDPDNCKLVVAVDPQEAFTMGTHFTCEASIDAKANWEEITMETTPFLDVGGIEHYEGLLTGITSRTDKTAAMRFKTVGKDVRLHAYGVAFTYD